MFPRPRHWMIFGVRGVRTLGLLFDNKIFTNWVNWNPLLKVSLMQSYEVNIKQELIPIKKKEKKKKKKIGASNG